MVGLWIKTIPAEELPEGRIRGVQVEGREILLANFEGVIYALSAICTHEQADLSEGTLVGHVIVCPLHFSEFDVRTGDVNLPPATDPLEKYMAEIREGYVMVEI
jgi:3-phenylpropionate/trans-cinnamate dioxygenase ferredoxin subunit